MTTENHYYYVIYSNPRRYIAAGLRPQVMWKSGDEINEAAWQELSRRDESEEELNSDDRLAFSVEALNGDGRLYKIFQTDKAGAAEFIEAAEEYGIADEARDLVEWLNS